AVTGVVTVMATASGPLGCVMGYSGKSPSFSIPSGGTVIGPAPIAMSPANVCETAGGAGNGGGGAGGQAGVTGTAGSTGFAGTIGTAGTTGAAGTTGTAGTTGAAGTTG